MGNFCDCGNTPPPDHIIAFNSAESGQSIKITQIPPLKGHVKQTYQKLKIAPFKHSYKTAQQIQNPFRLKKNGNIYHGQWKDGKPDGAGQIYLSQGNYYEGSFQAGDRNGMGIYINLDGSYYQGYFKAKHFKGVHKKSDGTQICNIDGQFNQYGQLDGQCKVSDQAGIFQGTFLNGKNIRGKYIYNQSKNYYDGPYLKNMKHGFGTLYNAQKEIIYQGYWEHDKPNGIGTVFQNGKSKLRTFWSDGVSRRDPKEYTISLK